jgi:hypothetical protein
MNRYVVAISDLSARDLVTLVVEAHSYDDASCVALDLAGYDLSGFDDTNEDIRGYMFNASVLVEARQIS